VSNATTAVKKGVVRWTDEFAERSADTLAAATTFYQNAMVGVDEAGYLKKFDDTAAMLFVGVVRGDQGNPKLPAGTANDGTLQLPYQKPRYLELQITSIAVTDIGKTVYAVDDQTGTLNYAAVTFANVVGQVVDVVATNIALVELCYDGVAGNERLKAAKRLAATGAQTISMFDLGKTLFCANTAALTLTLPAVANCQAGRRLTIIKDHASDTNAITLDGNGAETIEGSATVNSQDAPYDVVSITTNGTLWIYVGRDVA